MENSWLIRKFCPSGINFATRLFRTIWRSWTYNRTKHSRVQCHRERAAIARVTSTFLVYGVELGYYYYARTDDRRRKYRYQFHIFPFPPVLGHVVSETRVMASLFAISRAVRNDCSACSRRSSQSLFITQFFCEYRWQTCMMYYCERRPTGIDLHDWNRQILDLIKRSFVQSWTWQAEVRFSEQITQVPKLARVEGGSTERRLVAVHRRLHHLQWI